MSQHKSLIVLCCTGCLILLQSLLPLCHFYQCVCAYRRPWTNSACTLRVPSTTPRSSKCSATSSCVRVRVTQVFRSDRTPTCARCLASRKFVSSVSHCSLPLLYLSRAGLRGSKNRAPSISWLEVMK